MELTRPILILALQKLDRRSFVRFKEELSCWDVEEACRKILDLRLRDATPQIVGHQIRRYFGASYAIKLTQALLDSMNEKKIAEELQRDWEEGIMHPEQGNRMLPNDVLGTALRKLDRESFHRFKMVLNNVDVGISYKPIPMSLLDNANPESVAKLILYYYAIPHSVYVTWAVLEIINEKIIARELREDWDKECGGRLSIPSVACRIHLDQVPTSATVVGPDQSEPRTTEVDSSRIQEDRVENTR
ncbi:uncharacterized protein [Hyperolius riggenbachi]|uniref:uncharacterized protein n=1 Tax=Hyperolius riggenbachi TaxID=752182 RepID=UPI0035A34843